MEKTVHITGMHCASCAAGIQTFLRSQDGIEAAEVDFDSEKAHIEYTDNVDLTTVWGRIAEMGYEVESGDD